MLTTFGWDITCAVRVTEINRLIAERFKPFDLVAVDESNRLTATAGGWSIVPGGSGRSLRAVLRLENGSIVLGEGDSLSFSGQLHLTVQLEHVEGADRSDTVFIRRPTVNDVLLFDSLEAVLADTRALKWAVILLRDWLEANQNRFDQIVVEASLNHILEGTADMLGPMTRMGFAYGNAERIEDCVFAVLGGRDAKPSGIIEQDVPAALIAEGASSAFVISSTMVLELLRSHGLHNAFPGIEAEAYEIDHDGVLLRLCSPHKLDVKVSVKDHEFNPTLEYFELRIEGGEFSIHASCMIEQPEEFTARNTYRATHKLKLVEDAAAGWKVVLSDPTRVSTEKSMTVAEEARDRAKHASWAIAVLGTIAVIATEGLAAFAIGAATAIESSVVENAPDLAALLNPYEAPEIGLGGVTLMPSVAWGGRCLMTPVSVDLDRSLRIETNLVSRSV